MVDSFLRQSFRSWRALSYDTLEFKIGLMVENLEYT